MGLASAKFRKASVYFRQAGFTAVVSMVYDSALSRAQELRSILCSTVLQNAAALITDEPFMNVSVRLPQFIGEVLPSLITEYECRLNEGRDRTTKSISESNSLVLSLERTKAEVAEAEAKLRAAEEETAPTRQTVSDAKCC